VAEPAASRLQVSADVELQRSGRETDVSDWWTGVIGGAAVQVNVLINSNFASNIPGTGPVHGSATRSAYAVSDRVFGVAIAPDAYRRSLGALRKRRSGLPPYSRELDTPGVSADHPIRVGLIVSGDQSSR